MGKYSQGFCRRCSLGKTSNHQHVLTTRNPKDATECRQSGGHNCAGQIMRHDRTTHEEDTLMPVRKSARTSTERRVGHDSRVIEGNYSCEYRPSRTIHITGKKLGCRGKGKRSQSLAAENRMAMGLLTRSSSCGDMYCVRYEESDASSEASSGTESESSDVFVRDLDQTCSGSSCECKAENILVKHRGIGSDSMPDLNEVNVKNLKGNQLGLEVMLSLINGPMQSVIDSKDEKIRNLERAVERLECENKLMKHEQKPGETTKIFTLEKTLENCVRQIEQLEEEKRTVQEKVRLLDDLRKNDKECIDILRVQINDLELKLSKSDDRVREVEKEGKNHSQRLKQQYESRMDELQKALRSKESKLRDYDKIKSRVVKQKQELEDKKTSENELHSKMCEQIFTLKRELQLQQTKLNLLEKEKKALEESLSQSENLQRQDQKSSYVLQMKIVELQEKLEGSCRKNEELDKQGEAFKVRCQLLEDRLKEATKSLGRQSSEEKITKEIQPSGLDCNPSDADRENIESRYVHRRRNVEKIDDLGTYSSAFDHHVKDVLREKVVELHEKFYVGQKSIYGVNRSRSEEHIQNIPCRDGDSVQEQWRSKREYNAQTPHNSSISDGSLPERDVTSRKV